MKQALLINNHFNWVKNRVVISIIDCTIKKYVIYVRIGNTLLSTLMVKSCLIPDPHLHIIVNRVLN